MVLGRTKRTVRRVPDVGAARSPIQSTGEICASHSIAIWVVRKNVVLPRDARLLESWAARMRR